MKRILIVSIIIALILMIFYPVFAEEQNREDIDYDLSIMTKDNITFDLYAGFRYYYTDYLSSRIYLDRKNNEDEREIDNFRSSKLNETYTDITADIYVLEFHGSSFGKKLKLTSGIAFDYYYQKTNENGRFDAAGNRNNYNNDMETTFYSPKFEFQIKYITEFISFKYTAEYMPKCYYSFSQSIRIDPLVSPDETKNDYNDEGSSYFKDEFRLKIWNIVFCYIHEYEVINLELLEPAATSSGYEFQKKASQFNINNYILLANYNFKISGIAYLQIGAGKKIEQKVNDETGDRVRDKNQWIFNIGLTDSF